MGRVIGFFGGVAHLVEHLPCTEKVASSILVASTNLKKNYIMIKVAAGCYFEPEEDEPIDPIVGKKTSIDIPNPIYYRKSELDDVPDDYATRIMKMKKVEKNIPQREVKTPDGFAITIAYNKSGYQVIPKEDLKNFK